MATRPLRTLVTASLLGLGMVVIVDGGWRPENEAEWQNG
jgi:hypothetical protein